MKKTKLTLALLPLLLVSCGGSNEPSASVSADTETKFIVNASGREDEEYKNISTDPLNPSYPIIEGLLFDGWYTKKEGGELWDFASDKKPGNLYAHWKDYKARSDTEKLDAFLGCLAKWSGTVNHTIGEQEITIQYAISSTVFTGTVGFVSDRYENGFVQTKNYSPYYAETDNDVKDDDKGKTAEEVNQRNYFSLVEDSYTEGRVYSIYQYNKDREDYNSNNEDGYQKSAQLSEESASNYLDISFASYFLGYPNQLLSARKNGHEFYKAEETNDGSGDKEGDFYYFKNIDPTIIDPWGNKGADFEIAYAISTRAGQDIRTTDYYAASSGIGFKNGKIAHCVVEKINARFLNNEAYRVQSTQSFYDFQHGDYENRAYTGKKLDYKDFNEYTD